MANFVAPTDEVAATFSHTLLQIAKVKPPAVRKDVTDTEGWDLMAGRLQGNLDEIERSWC